MLKYFSIIGLIIVFFTSCFEEDERIQPRERQEVKIPQSLYSHQSYFDLESAKTIFANHVEDWDLGFESSADGWHIILNTSKYMYISNTHNTDFEAVTSKENLIFSFDVSSGNLDSTAIGEWLNRNSEPYQSKNEVYIVNLGVDEDGLPLGEKKVVFTSLTNNTYSLKFADLNGENMHEFAVEKIDSVEFTLFSFADGGKIFKQIARSKWDIQFTQYASILFDNVGTPTDYLVRGVMLNKGVEAAVDTINNFSAVDYSYIDNYTFSARRDFIGWEWKVYRNDEYQIESDRFYVIKNRSGRYFKLRFTSFYSETGERGFTSFELVELLEL